jgi:hypothetical protein
VYLFEPFGAFITKARNLIKVLFRDLDRKRDDLAEVRARRSNEEDSPQGKIPNTESEGRGRTRQVSE